eukprot:COSAG02_NODE_80_length_40128_cov_591.169002_14_plen_46_part_00
MSVAFNVTVFFFEMSSFSSSTLQTQLMNACGDVAIPRDSTGLDAL